MKTEILRFESVNYHEHNNELLYQINMNLFRGEILGIIARNKFESDALRELLIGNSSISGGRIFCNDRSMGSNLKNCPLNPHCIYSRSQLIASMTIAENIFVIQRSNYYTEVINTSKINRQTRELLQNAGLDVSPGKLASELDICTNHMIEILKAITLGCRLLVLDNITALYSDRDIKKLGSFLRSICGENLSVIVLSNTRNELMQDADRISVVRDGTIAQTLIAKNISANTLFPLLAGGSVTDMQAMPDIQSIDSRLEFIDFLPSKHFSSALNLELKKSEALGFLLPNWDSGIALADSLFGQIPYRGQVLLDGKPISNRSIKEAIKNGMGIIRDDFNNDDIFYNMNLIDNITITLNKTIFGPFRIDYKHIKQYEYKRAVEYLHLDALDSQCKKSNALPPLNAFNIMKIRMARLLCAHPKVIILLYPLLGFDEITIEEFGQIIQKLRSLGISFIIISTNITNLTKLCGRILVQENNGFCSYKVN